MDPNLESIPEPIDDEPEDRVEECKKRVDDHEVMCCGHILNTLSDSLYDFCNSMQFGKEIWNSLVCKYKVGKL